MRTDEMIAVFSTPERAQSATMRLLESGMAEETRAASWFSHQQGHTTGTGVERGAGDSEAGISDYQH